MDLSFVDARFFEMLFLICFGLAWPSNIVKSVRSKTSKGKSLPFLLIALTGYVCGITSKLIDDTLSYTVAFYSLNLIMVAIDTALYFVNAKRDRLADAFSDRKA